MFVGDVHYGGTMFSKERQEIEYLNRVKESLEAKVVKELDLKLGAIAKVNELRGENWKLGEEIKQLNELLDYEKGVKIPVFLDGNLICEKVVRAWDIEIPDGLTGHNITSIAVDSTKRYQVKVKECEELKEDNAWVRSKLSDVNVRLAEAKAWNKELQERLVVNTEWKQKYDNLKIRYDNLWETMQRWTTKQNKKGWWR